MILIKFIYHKNIKTHYNIKHYWYIILQFVYGTFFN